MKLAASGHDAHRHFHHWTPGWLVNLLAFALGLILAFAVYSLLVSARADGVDPQGIHRAPVAATAIAANYG